VRITAAPVASSKALLERIEAGTDLVAVEETQFFDGSVVDALQALANRGVEVIASGLDLDFRGGPPFGRRRGGEAACDLHDMRSRRLPLGRLVDGEPAPPPAPTILVGASEHYEARCRHHHEAG
jgi:thymidine kinase